MIERQNSRKLEKISYYHPSNPRNPNRDFIIGGLNIITALVPLMLVGILVESKCHYVRDIYLYLADKFQTLF